jgi:hypothetical protein
MIGFYSLVEISFDPTKVANGGDHQVYRERGRADQECEVCVEERQLLVIDGRPDGQQCRKEDGIELNEGGLDSYINVRGRPSHQDPWTQSEY